VEKNHEFLINVFKELKAMHPESALVSVGAGNKKHIERIVEDNKLKDVHFLGLRSDVPYILQAIDIFIFPSTNEGLPVTLIEAQASGLKIIASDGISKELNITSQVDFISLKKSPKFWAEYILKSVKYTRKNTVNKITEANYDININALQLQQFYCKTLN
uniref:glycosyltransferase n=1 Tax=Mariniflexile sp. TaxID=1979402 RepID=UPI004047B752